MATGDIGTLIDHLDYLNDIQELVKISDTIYAVPQRISSSLRVYTFSCNAAGQISNAALDYETLVSNAVSRRSMFHVSGNIWGIAYINNVSGSYYEKVVTFSIDPVTGAISPAIANTAITPEGSAYYITTNYMCPAVLSVDGNTMFAVFGSTTHSGTWFAIKTFTVSNDGVNIAGVSLYELAIAGNIGTVTPIEITDNIFATMISGRNSQHNWLKTLSISNAGVIAAIGSVDLGTGYSDSNDNTPGICHVAGSIWALAFTAAGPVPTLDTIEITAAGAIGAVIDTDTALIPYRENYLKNVNDSFFLVCSGQINAEIFRTFAIAADGTIGATIDSYSPPSTSGFYGDLIFTGVGNMYVGQHRNNTNTVVNFSIDVITPNPAIETLGTSELKHDRATLWANITEVGGATEYGFDWSLGTGAFENELQGTDPIISGLYCIALTGLTYNTSYKYRAKLRRTGGTWVYGTTGYFTTSFPVPQVSTELPTAAGDHYIDAVGCLETDGGVVAVDKYGFTYGTNTIEDMLGRFDYDLDHSYSPDDAKADGYDENEQITGSLAAPLLASNAASGQPDVIVANATGISAGLVFKLVDTDNDELLTVDHIVGTTVTMTTNLVHSYTTAKEARLCQVVTIKLRNLEYGKRYYARFWAHNAYGYGWGSEICALTSDTVNVMIPTATASKGIRFCIPGKVNFPPSGMFYDTRHHLLVKCPDSYFVDEGTFGWVVGMYVCERQYWGEATNMDLYTMSNAIRRTGTPIKVKYKARIGNNNYGVGQYHKRVINNGTSNLTGSYVSSSSILAWFCEIWYNNPWTSSPWSIAETDDLQMGISIRSGTGWEIPLCDCIEGRIIWVNAAVSIKAPAILSATSIKLHGLVTEDEAEACTVKFQYGLTVAYGSETAMQSAVKGQHVYATISVVAGTAYHFRAAITTACGETFYSSDWEFGGPELEMAFGQSIFTASPVWTDVSAYLMDGYVKRGRMHQLDKCEAGTAVFILNNASGNWWRNNTGGLYTPNVKPLTLVRWRRDFNGMNPIYYGIIENFEPGWLEERGGFTPIMMVSAADVLKSFAKYRIVDANPTLTADATTGLDYAYVDDTYGLVEGQTIKLYDDNGEENLVIQQVVPATKVVIFTTVIVGNYYTGDNAKLKKWPAVLSGTRINDIVLEIGWPLSLCSIDTGEVMLIELTPGTGGSVALEEMHNAAESEDGNIFVSAAGVLTYHDALARTVAPYNQSQATLIDTGNQFANPELVDDDEFTFNEASISGNGISEQIMVDGTAQQAQGPRVISRKNSQIYNEYDAIRQCLMLVLRYKQSTMRCKALHILPDADPDALYPMVYGYDLITRITLQINSAINPAMIDQAYHIEGLTHRWNMRKGWRTTWQLWATNRYRAFSTHHDGWIGNVSEIDYNTCHNAASGSVGPYNDDGFGLGLSAGQQSTYVGVIFMSARIDRGVVEFNTASLSGFTILEAFLLFKSELIYNNNAWKLNLVNNNGVTCPVEATDYGELHNATTLMANELDMEAPVGWKTFELNATGLAAINKTGVTRFGLRSNRDVAGTDPGETSKEYLHIANLGYYDGAYQMQLIVRLL